MAAMVEQMTEPFKKWLMDNGLKDDSFNQQSWDNLTLFTLFSEFIVSTQSSVIEKAQERK
jgi:hypothetical protein